MFKLCWKIPVSIIYKIIELFIIKRQNGYNFLNNDQNFTHEIHNHGHGDFGTGKNSISHAEVLWAEMKKDFFAIYGIIPMNNFIYFLREIELRVIIKKKSDDEKLNIFREITKTVYDNCKFKFSDKTELENFLNLLFILIGLLIRNFIYLNFLFNFKF